jgi:hypothetical protein
MERSICAIKPQKVWWHSLFVIRDRMYVSTADRACLSVGHSSLLWHNVCVFVQPHRILGAIFMSHASDML